MLAGGSSGGSSSHEVAEPVLSSSLCNEEFDEPELEPELECDKERTGLPGSGFSLTVCVADKGLEANTDSLAVVGTRKPVESPGLCEPGCKYARKVPECVERVGEG